MQEVRLLFFFFFFKQKTAYEVTRRDWSSDVCSSDLKETEFAAGYVRVKTPHLAREKMYKTSGHLPYYAESMFPAIEVFEDGALQHATEEEKGVLDEMHQKIAADLAKENPDWSKEEVDQELENMRKMAKDFEKPRLSNRYYLKAMNCPH